MTASDSEMAKRVAEVLRALEESEATAETTLVTSEGEERELLQSFLSLASRLSRAGQDLAAASGGPSEEAFLARLYSSEADRRAGSRWRLPRVQSLPIATRSMLAGGVLFLGLTIGAASAFGGDPLGISQTFPLLTREPTATEEPSNADQRGPQLSPLQNATEPTALDEATSDSDGTPPGQGGENSGGGVGPDGTPPGQGGENPGGGVGNDGTPPGQGGDNPGGGVGPDGTPPGQGGENPGGGAGNGQGNGNGKKP